MLKETAEMLTGEKHAFTIHATERKWFKKKHVEYPYDIAQLNLFTMIRISKEVLNIDKSIFNASLVSSGMKTLSQHGEVIVMIVAYAVLNADEKPSKTLLKHISMLNSIELLEVVTAVLKQMNLKPFMTSIISISGVNLMEMNPKSQGS